MYDLDGIEIFEPVADKPVSKSMREMYKDFSMPVQAQPFSDEEFREYIQQQGEDVMNMVINAGQFLKQLSDKPNKLTLIDAIADYVIDELVINRITKVPDEPAERAYAYYLRMFWRMYDTIDFEE